MFIGFRLPGVLCVFSISLEAFSIRQLSGACFGVSLDVPRLLGIAHRNPTGKYLKLPSGQDLQYPSDGWEWDRFPEQSRLLTTLAHGHVPYFKLKFSLTLSLGT